MGLTFEAEGQKSSAGTSQKGEPLGAKALWSKSLQSVEADAKPDNSQQWLTAIRFVAEVNKSIVIAAPDQLTLDRVTTDFARPLQQAWLKLDAKQRRLKFELWDSVAADVREMVGDPWLAESEQRRDETERRPRDTRDQQQHAERGAAHDRAVAPRTS